MRIVTHACSNTELVCALGRADWLVGCDDDSDHPPEVVARLPRVGRDLDVDPERVKALRPDLVIASMTVPGHEKVVERLGRAHLPLLVLSPASYDDVLDNVRLLGQVLDARDEAERLRARLAGAAASRTPPPDAPRVLVEWWPRPVIAAGARSWIDGMLAAAGARNALADHDAETVQVDPELAARLAPDLVVVAWCGVPPSHLRPDVVLRRAGWAQVPAVRAGRVVAIPEAFLGRPGPRLAEGIERIRAALRSM